MLSRCVIPHGRLSPAVKKLSNHGNGKPQAGDCWEINAQMFRKDNIRVAVGQTVFSERVSRANTLWVSFSSYSSCSG